MDGLAEGIILFVAISQLFAGEINIEGFLLYIYVARLILGPVNEFSSYFLWLQRIFASSERINEYFALKSNIESGEIQAKGLNSDLEFKDIEFSYDQEIVLKDINLSIKKDEITAIVGKSGSGKSTLIDLILRFYDPSKGKVFLDGVDLKSFNLESYRNLFGVVFQDVSLLNDTIENNILYGSCLLYTSPSPRDRTRSRMPSSA